MMKLFSQLEQVDNATPLARSDDGNISAEGISLGLKHWSHAWPTRPDPTKRQSCQVI